MTAGSPARPRQARARPYDDDDDVDDADDDDGDEDDDEEDDEEVPTMAHRLGRPAGQATTRQTRWAWPCPRAERAPVARSVGSGAWTRGPADDNDTVAGGVDHAHGPVATAWPPQSHSPVLRRGTAARCTERGRGPAARAR